jgi:hypothetical protein
MQLSSILHGSPVSGCAGLASNHLENVNSFAGIRIPMVGEPFSFPL